MSEGVVTGPQGAAERRDVISRGISQGILGAGAVILGIVGLAIPTTEPMVPTYLDAIGGLILGLSLIVVGIGLSAAYARLLATAESAGEAGGHLAGTTVDVFLGSAVVILGVLAILGVVAAVLIAIQVILIGVGLMVGAAASVRLASLEGSVAAQQQSLSRRITEELAFATASVRAAAGVAVLVLGILGVIGTDPIDLSLVAIIIAGAALMFNSTSLSGRIVGMIIR